MSDSRPRGAHWALFSSACYDSKMAPRGPFSPSFDRVRPRGHPSMVSTVVDIVRDWSYGVTERVAGLKQGDVTVKDA